MPAVWKKGVWVLWHQLCKVGRRRKGGLWDAEGCIHGATSRGRQLRCDDQKLQEQELYPGACQWLNLQQGNEMLKQFHLFHMLMKISILYSLYVFLQHKWGASTVQWVPPRCSYISREHPKMKQATSHLVNTACTCGFSLLWMKLIWRTTHSASSGGLLSKQLGQDL